MAKYKINLDPVWNLPVGTGSWCKEDGSRCALGLIHAGIFGSNVSPYTSKMIKSQLTGTMIAIQRHTEETKALARELIGVCTGIDFDMDVRRTVRLKKHFMSPAQIKEMVREKWVRKILEYGIKNDLFEIEGLKVNDLLKQKDQVAV